ncbi:2-amino-4-hydroxy-6-hydroxymethyldihydropteridine diphosphokinase [Paracoccaceae bacterium]|nr:2-amino-4-hydroxy-6-hydroxymethyldihydropteridine diphosphokinase [Paracoccaceae bacterium]
MNNFIIVLGSNLPSKFGSSVKTLEKCLDEIRSSPLIKKVSESMWYHSLSIPNGDDPPFVNVGLRFNSKLNPNQLLSFTSILEKKYERTRESRWNPRTCDIDILLCDQKILPNQKVFEKWFNFDLKQQIMRAPSNLILPHPRLHERHFFLRPLYDLQPNWIHPFLKKTVKEMLDSIPSDELENIKVL